MEDRGLVKAGFKADFNVIDYENLTYISPKWSTTFPAAANGWFKVPTVIKPRFAVGCAYRDGQHTGQLPGRLIRVAKSERFNLGSCGRFSTALLGEFFG